MTPDTEVVDPLVSTAAARPGGTKGDDNEVAGGGGGGGDAGRSSAYLLAKQLLFMLPAVPREALATSLPLLQAVKSYLTQDKSVCSLVASVPGPFSTPLFPSHASSRRLGKRKKPFQQV